MRFAVFVLLSLLLSAPVAGWALDATGEERKGEYFQRHGYYAHEKFFVAEYGQLPFATYFPKAQLRRLLQEYVKREHNRSFRHLGDGFDFFHGHLLVDNTDPMSGPVQPLLVLYHTQEDAHAHHECCQGHKYDYLNKWRRNSVQWPEEPAHVANALDYIYDDLYGSPLITDWHRGAFFSHHTVFEVMLDPRKTGVAPKGDLQWNFYRASCEKMDHVKNVSRSNMVDVRLPDRTRVCLYFFFFPTIMPIQ